MRAVLITTDPVEQNFAEALLTDADIAHVVFDVQVSIMEGSMGIFPRRLMVADGDYRQACTVLHAGLPGYVPLAAP